jgi:hypothetical protein
MSLEIQTTNSCPDDLLVLAQRGLLLPHDRRTLDEHAARCDACRMSVALGRLFGPLPDVDDTDASLSARVVARLRQPDLHARPTRASRSRTTRRKWITFAVLLTSLAGFASAAIWQHSRQPVISPANPPSGPEHSRSASRQPVPQPVTEPALEEQGPGPPPRTPMQVPNRQRSPAATADALLRAANLARSEDRAADAIRLYQALDQQFPGTGEANVSLVSLADLYLSQASPDQALITLDRYLEQGHVDLAEEALVKKARALEQLHRMQDEIAVWRLLMQRFPSSSYRWRAEQRRQELDNERRPP